MESKRNNSIVQDLGVDTSGCGYCDYKKILSNNQEEHGPSTSTLLVSKRRRPMTRVSHGMWAHQLTVEDYEELMTRGWRRSGKYIYRPDNMKSCCQQFVIRLEADKFVPNKSQRRVVKKIEKYLSNSSSATKQDKEKSRPVFVCHKCSKHSELQDPFLEEIRQCLCELVRHIVDEKAIQWGWKVWYNTKASERTDMRCYSSNLILILAQHRSHESSWESANLDSVSSMNRKQKSQSEFSQWRDYYSSILKNAAEDMFAKKYFNCSITSNGFMNIWREDQSLEQQRCLCTGSRTQDSMCTKTEKAYSYKETELSFTTEKRLHVVMELPKLEDESFLLFQRYQQAVHHEDPSEQSKESFSRFLVDTPLIFVRPNTYGTSPSCGFGTFHMKYFLDQRLIAVGVVDILPHYFSSVYFFYDPSYAKLSLGVYSALREFEWVRTQSLQGYTSLQYYCMGFYIHNCAKMRYKGNYFPSQLRCEVTGQWIQLEMAQKALDAHNGRALRLAPDSFPVDDKYLVAPCEKVFTLLSPQEQERYRSLWEEALQNVPLLFNGKLFLFRNWKQSIHSKMRLHIQKTLLTYISKVGPHLGVRVIYLL